MSSHMAAAQNHLNMQIGQVGESSTLRRVLRLQSPSGDGDSDKVALAQGVSKDDIKDQLKVVGRSIEYRAFSKAVDGLESFLGMIRNMHM